MHLLLAQQGSISEGGEAIDLGQTVGDIVFLSAADTELASLAQAQQVLLDGEGEEETLSLRLANLMHLSHPMSVDVYAEKTAAKAKLIIIRVLGGESYWSYGLETLYQLANSAHIKLAVVPGDDKPDPGLDRYSTLPRNAVERIWAYLNQGGAENAVNLLRYGAYLLGQGGAPAEAIPLLKAGLWWPGKEICSLTDITANWQEGAGVVAISFYRALVQSGNLEPIEALVTALGQRGLNPLPVFIASLKDRVSVETLRGIFARHQPDVVLNSSGFAVASPSQTYSCDGSETYKGTVLDEGGAVVLQIILAGGSQQSWQTSPQGLSAVDLAMNVALPEVDGRVLSRAIAFKNGENYNQQVEANIVAHQGVPDRVEFVCDLAASWVALRRSSRKARKVGVILANYPNRDGRIGNGVGLDTPASTVGVLNALKQQGYVVGDEREIVPGCLPKTGDELIGDLQKGPTNKACKKLSHEPEIRETLSLAAYQDFFSHLPAAVREAITARWGPPQDDPFFHQDRTAFALPIKCYGNIAVGIQPARGFNIDPKQTYHCPDLVPPHGYLAFYGWLRQEFGAHALIHMGKHGNLEWLPGKALSLSEDCYPEAVMGPLPHLYPFIVNDPGEGAQAKRRSAAVIIDHLTPPLTRAESYGPLRDLEALVDEYYQASGYDPRRLVFLKQQIFNLIQDIGLDLDAGIEGGDCEAVKLEKLDAFLCELKEMQIRDGLHIFGRSPQGRLAHDLTVALVRVPRGFDGCAEGGDQSLQRALAKDLGLQLGGEGFDPLDCDMAQSWQGARPQVLADMSGDLWRSNGDVVERIELLASALVSGEIVADSSWVRTQQVLQHISQRVLPALRACGGEEMAGLLAGLDGRFVAPGPSGAPTRGRFDVLPTGRNFYSVDSRAIPTPAAWALGQKSAELLIKRYRQDHGDWPSCFGLSVWGTSNMRTGGDDIAQALALIGAKPLWDNSSRRLVGYEIITLAELGRPRIDVTLRISGFFRDAFPVQIHLYDKAVRAIGALQESSEDNPIAARMRQEKESFIAKGVGEEEAGRLSGFRIFGAKPGAYGAGLQALIDEKGWEERSDLAEAYLSWGSYAYGTNETGSSQRASFEARLKGMEAVIHNQDNREHDLLDSDDYYQFEGGMTAAVEQLSGARPSVYHNDHSRPEKPVVRALEEEIARVVRARVVNPKWIEGVMRHGYKGAFEMAASLDYLFAFSATTGAVRNHHFELVYQAYLANPDVLAFLQNHNSEALKEMAERFLEAEERELWTPRSNSAKFALKRLAGRVHEGG